MEDLFEIDLGGGKKPVNKKIKKKKDDTEAVEEFESLFYSVDYFLNMLEPVEFVDEEIEIEVRVGEKPNINNLIDEIVRSKHRDLKNKSLVQIVRYQRIENKTDNQKRVDFI